MAITPPKPPNPAKPGLAPLTPASPRPAPAAAAPVQPLALSPLIREFEFTSADFERVRKLIYQRAGISLSTVKQDMVYSRLARRVRATGARTFTQYLDALERNGGGEWEAFVNSLTTNLTSFFREAHHFPMLSDHLRKQAGRPLRIWCCAASTGEEPYSLAMTVLETFGASNPSVSILASDIDTNVLATADKGFYPADRVDRLGNDRLTRFFQPVPAAQGGGYRVKPELRRLIEFRQINLLAPSWPLNGQFDAIFCRNVMIYFDKPTQYRILSRFVPALRPDGLLFAGHSESFVHAADLFRSIGKTVYQPMTAAVTR